MKLPFVITLAILAAAPAATAQEPLTKEITVDHDVVPERRDVNRLNYTPASTLPVVQATRVPYSERTVNITVPGEANTLAPAAYADTIYTSPYRGYAALGYFPLFNAAASAGYKFIDNDHTRLAGFLQYDGSFYKAHFPDGSEPKHCMNYNTAMLSTTLHQAVGKKSFIDAGADFTMARYNSPAGADLMLPQMMRRFNLNAAWFSNAAGIDYSAGITYSHFGYNNNLVHIYPERELFNPVRENLFKFSGFMKTHLSGGSWVGLNADFSLVNNTRRTEAFYSLTNEAYMFADHGSYTHALLTLKPFYRFDIRNFRLDLGARIDFTFNAGKAFHIAPAALASWRPVKLLAIYAKAGGGEHQNTLGNLYGVTPFAQGNMAYSNSHIPITLEGGVTFGTWKGAYAKAAICYARANSWLMPVSDPENITIFKPVDMRGFHWRAEAGYAYRNLGSLSLSYEGSPQGYDKGYYLWHDRAKAVVNARLKVTPISPLDITLNYELRTGRAMIDYTRSADPAVESYYARRSLGRLSNLSLGGLYRLTDQFSVFATFSNILNSRPYYMGLVQMQGFNGLFGASYKF